MLVLKCRNCHFTKWQIQPFIVKVTMHWPILSDNDPFALYKGDNNYC